MPPNLDDILLASIPEAPSHITAPQLREKVERSAKEKSPDLRTIQRALIRLSGERSELVCEESKPHRWYWKVGTKSRAVARMDAATALAFGLLEKHLDGLIPAPFRADLEPMFRKAEEITLSLPHARLRRWQARTTTGTTQWPLRSPEVGSEMLRAVQDALLDHVQLDINYRKHHDGDLRHHRLHPQGLVLADGVFYLVATNDKHETPAHYALHRIESAQSTTLTSRDLPHFDANDYVNKHLGLQFTSGKRIRLRLRARWHFRVILRERPLSDDQRIRPIDDEWSEIIATVTEAEQLQWWLMSWANSCEVLAPKTWRASVMEAARATARLYATKPKSGTGSAKK